MLARFIYCVGKQLARIKYGVFLHGWMGGETGCAVA